MGLMSVFNRSYLVCFSQLKLWEWIPFWALCRKIQLWVLNVPVFCAGISQLQHGVVLVSNTFYFIGWIMNLNHSLLSFWPRPHLWPMRPTATLNFRYRINIKSIAYFCIWLCCCNAASCMTTNCAKYVQPPLYCLNPLKNAIMLLCKQWARVQSWRAWDRHVWYSLHSDLSFCFNLIWLWYIDMNSQMHTCTKLSLQLC